MKREYKKYLNDNNIDENFKNEYLDGDNYLFMDKIKQKNMDLFRIILLIIIISVLYISYLVINRVFFSTTNPAPKLLLVLYIFILTLFYLIYLEFSVKITNIIIDNSYSI